MQELQSLVGLINYVIENETLLNCLLDAHKTSLIELNSLNVLEGALEEFTEINHSGKVLANNVVRQKLSLFIGLKINLFNRSHGVQLDASKRLENILRLRDNIQQKIHEIIDSNIKYKDFLSKLGNLLNFHVQQKTDSLNKIELYKAEITKIRAKIRNNKKLLIAYKKRHNFFYKFLLNKAFLAIMPKEIVKVYNSINKYNKTILELKNEIFVLSLKVKNEKEVIEELVENINFTHLNILNNQKKLDSIKKENNLYEVFSNQDLTYDL